MLKYLKIYLMKADENDDLKALDILYNNTLIH